SSMCSGCNKQETGGWCLNLRAAMERPAPRCAPQSAITETSMNMPSLLVALSIALLAPVATQAQGSTAGATGAAAAASAAQPLSPARVAALTARLQGKLDSLHAAGRFPGATFAVALPDGSVIAIATGMSDTTRKIAMTPAHLMPQGSVGK